MYPRVCKYIAFQSIKMMQCRCIDETISFSAIKIDATEIPDCSKQIRNRSIIGRHDKVLYRRWAPGLSLLFKRHLHFSDAKWTTRLVCWPTGLKKFELHFASTQLECTGDQKWENKPGTDIESSTDHTTGNSTIYDKSRQNIEEVIWDCNFASVRCMAYNENQWTSLGSSYVVCCARCALSWRVQLQMVKI